MLGKVRRARVTQEGERITRRVPGASERDGHDVVGELRWELSQRPGSGARYHGPARIGPRAPSAGTHEGLAAVSGDGAGLVRAGCGEGREGRGRRTGYQNVSGRGPGSNAALPTSTSGDEGPIVTVATPPWTLAFTWGKRRPDRGRRGTAAASVERAPEPLTETA